MRNNTTGARGQGSGFRGCAGGSPFELVDERRTVGDTVPSYSDGDTLRLFGYFCDIAGCFTNVALEGETLPCPVAAFDYGMRDRLGAWNSFGIWSRDMRLSAVALIVMTSVAALPAQQTNSLLTFQRLYEQQQQAVLTRYGQDLDATLAGLQARGDLENLLTLQAEKKRFGEEHTVPLPADAAEAYRPATAAYYQALIRRITQYVAALEGHIKLEVVAGRIETAKAARDEKERAVILLADLQSRVPPAAATAGSAQTGTAPAVPPVGRHNSTTPAGGLVLWNRLDSEADVARSAVGPAGKLSGGRFVEGRFGKGIELNMQEPFGISFPLDVVKSGAGCIEFWARLVDFPDHIPQGYCPSLIRSDVEEGHGFHLFFAPNNGNAGGGLCINSRFGWVGSGSFGSWTYARALKSAESGDWHHYALVWSGTGKIPGVADKSRKICLFLDGTPISETGYSESKEQQLFAPAAASGRFGFIGYASGLLPRATIVFDNLMVWNRAKGDFAGRDVETPK